MKRLILIALLLLSGCASISHTGKQAETGKQDCDGNQCPRQVTPNDVLTKKPLVYY